jgi:hypothetical protein
MTGRDLTPPVQPAQEQPVWELWLGHDLEQFYEYFLEPFFQTPGTFPDETIERIRVLRSWTEHHLRLIGIPDILISAADRAVADVRRRTRVTDSASRRKLRSVADTFEVLLQLSRSHIAPRRRRYFDYGVMLRRISFCELACRLLQDAEDKVLALNEAYRREHRRVCAALVSFVREDETDNPFDPELHDLDARFAEFADYLATWLEHDVEPDDTFRERLGAAENAARILSMFS